MGRHTTASGAHAFTSGRNSEASGNYATAMGYGTIASGNNAHATGFNTTASGISTTAMGHNTTANDLYSTAMGRNALASGKTSIAMGEDPIASGDYALATGNNTWADGNSATAMGTETYAPGNNALAGGYQTTASGIGSVALGSNTVASEDFTFSMGVDAEASGPLSSSIGVSTIASGESSVAIGFHSTASGKGSYAMGSVVKAPSAYETAFGRYNTDYIPNSTTAWDNEDRLFSIGNGTGSTNKQDALVILKNGNMGIGVVNPANRLDVKGDSVRFDVKKIQGTDLRSIEFNFLSSEDAMVISSGLLSITIKSDEIYPSIYEEGYVGTFDRPFWKIYANGFYASSSNNYSTYSDKRIKQNIHPILSPLDKVLKLNGVTYDITKNHFYRGGNDNPRLKEQDRTNRIGFIAQDVEEVLPQLVTEDEDSGLMAVGYMGLIPVLVEAMKEQQEIIEGQQQKIDELEQRLIVLERK
jgi:hypothetical protein